MKQLKLLGPVFGAVLAVCAIASSPAFAAASILGGNTTLTGKSGEAILESVVGEKIVCTASTSTGSVTSETTGTATVTFTGCTIGGVAAKSLGAASGTIEVVGTFVICDINKATEDVGLNIFLPTAGVHIEAPLLGALVVVTGNDITLISPTKSSKTGPFTLTIKQSKGMNEFQKCEGGAVQNLKSAKNEGTPVEAGEEVKGGTITFAAARELMA